MARRNHEGDDSNVGAKGGGGDGDRPPLIEKALRCLVGILLIIKIIYQTQ
jgi:hypothetical protein